MKDPHRFSFPPSKSDIVLLVGLAMIVYTGIEKAWGVLVVGVVVMLAGLLSDRMVGPFSLGNEKFHFRGELLPSTPSFRGAVVEPARDDQFRGILEPGPDS
jgi:hypothetical protein